MFLNFVVQISGRSRQIVPAGKTRDVEQAAGVQSLAYRFPAARKPPVVTAREQSLRQPTSGEPASYPRQNRPDQLSLSVCKMCCRRAELTGLLRWNRMPDWIERSQSMWSPGCVTRNMRPTL